MAYNHKPPLLAVGTFINGYSFTRVLEALLQQLAAYYTIHWLGLGYRGEKKEMSWGTLYPSNLKGGDVFGAYEAASMAKELQAGNILLLTDIYLLRHYVRAWTPLKQEGIRLVAYTPLEGPLTNVQLVNDITFLDELVLYHTGAVTDMKKAIHEWRQQDVNTNILLPEISYRYHGTDTIKFRPSASSAEQQQLKQELFAVPDAANAVFVLNVNRFRDRKDLGSTITGFARAFPNFTKPVYLCLHTPGLDEYRQAALQTLIQQSGCADSILLNPLGNNYIPDEQLAKLYQACDIGVNTSLGEGWGMISFEHAACGAAQVVPDNSACKELWTAKGIVIPCPHTVHLDGSPFLLHGVDTDVLAEKLVQLVNDEAYLQTASEQCFQYVQQEVFDWKKIGDSWQTLLNRNS